MGHVLIKSQFRKLKKQLYHNVNHTQIREQQKETFFFLADWWNASILGISMTQCWCRHMDMRKRQRETDVLESFTGDRQLSAPVTGRLWDFPVGHV